MMTGVTSSTDEPKRRETLTAALREAADEIEQAHRVLDEIGAVDELTLAARIATHAGREDLRKPKRRRAKK